MNVIVTAATIGEWMPAFTRINTLYTERSQRLKLRFHQSGVGLTASVFALTRLVLEEKPSLVVQVGLAGCFAKKHQPGRLFAVGNDLVADQGVMEDGKWKDVFDLKLEKKSYPPYAKKCLPNPWLPTFNLLKLPVVNAITVNQVSTDSRFIKEVERKYEPYLETMEGAALHYVCRQTQTPFLQVRAVSNLVGERDKSKWAFRESLDNLNAFIEKYVDKLYKIA